MLNGLNEFITSIFFIMLVTQGFSHILVEVDGISVLHKLPDHFTLVILYHQYLRIVKQGLNEATWLSG